MAAAVPGLGVATIWCRTPSNGDWLAREGAQLSLWHEEGVKPVVAPVQELRSKKDSRADDLGESEACTPVTAINAFAIFIGFMS